MEKLMSLRCGHIQVKYRETIDGLRLAHPPTVCGNPVMRPPSRGVMCRERGGIAVVHTAALVCSATHVVALS